MPGWVFYRCGELPDGVGLEPGPRRESGESLSLEAAAIEPAAIAAIAIAPS